jgi:VIT1/CCC1 family predicted Fe2+/Mn2+ transporter
MKEKFLSRKNKFVFGSTSAIITNLALIVGLNNSVNAKLNIIAGILVIAIADNISDTLAIHMYQEAEGLTKKEVWLSSCTNFLMRFLVSMVFIVLVVLLQLNVAIICSIIIGLFIIAIISYDLAKHKNMNPSKTIMNHLLVALIVILASNFLSNWISTRIR